MTQSSDKLKQEIREQVIARFRQAKKRASVLNALMAEQNTPIEIVIKRDTWKNLYPKFKDRVLAYLYSWLHAVAPKYFVTRKFEESWLTYCFPFKRHIMHDDLAEVEQEAFDIKLADETYVLADVEIQPITPTDGIKINFQLDE